MREAHVFQHSYTGVQIFVYDCNDPIEARSKLASLVVSSRLWIYLCKKVAIDA